MLVDCRDLLAPMLKVLEPHTRRLLKRPNNAREDDAYPMLSFLSLTLSLADDDSGRVTSTRGRQTACQARITCRTNTGNNAPAQHVDELRALSAGNSPPSSYGFHGTAPPSRSFQPSRASFSASSPANFVRGREITKPRPKFAPGLINAGHIG